MHVVQAVDTNGNVKSEEKMKPEWFEDEKEKYEFDDTETTDDSIEIKMESEIDSEGLKEIDDELKYSMMLELGWTEQQIDNKCRIDESGIIHYKCDREVNNHSGVEYINKIVEIEGYKIEVDVPCFESRYDAKIDESFYQKSNGAQFRECNRQLLDAIEKDSNLKIKFTEKEIEQLKKGETPDNYSWHHEAEPGVMQLVETAKHDRTVGGAPHTGGRSLWCHRNREGVKF